MSINQKIVDLGLLKEAFENANINSYDENRKLAKTLKEILLEIGMKSDAISFETFYSNFYIKPHESHKLWGDWSDKWQNARDGLSTLCTKAITILERNEDDKDRKIKALEDRLKQFKDSTKIEGRTVSGKPTTNWKLTRNLGFWGVWISATSLLCWITFEIGKAQERGDKNKAETELENKLREFETLKEKSKTQLKNKSDTIELYYNQVDLLEIKIDSIIKEIY
ncbi:hypothetical protein [Cecembia rubra]|uniref:Uncharacterized protein n=1 Tax=Cecembia rubra TaxID=1485585 RepID=A0A2P8DM83_9BACT|nr:hypothetical protein [Cecembia rubra]PSK98316.1 hypothetical protein CLV48_11915 [Cecembia rubra]